MAFLNLPLADGNIGWIRHDSIIGLGQDAARPRQCLVIVEHTTWVAGVEFEPGGTDWDQTDAAAIIRSMIETAEAEALAARMRSDKHG